MRIDENVFKYIEHEMFNYEATKKELEQYKEDIIEGSAKPEVNESGGRTGDATSSKAIKLSSSTFILNCERTTRAIDDSLKLLGGKYTKLFNFKYLKGISKREIELELNISSRTYYRMRRELVSIVGQKLGLINID